MKECHERNTRGKTEDDDISNDFFPASLVFIFAAVIIAIIVAQVY